MNQKGNEMTDETRKVVGFYKKDKSQEEYNKKMEEIARRQLSENGIRISDKNIINAIDNMEDGLEYLLHIKEYIEKDDYKAMEEWLLKSIKAGAFNKHKKGEQYGNNKRRFKLEGYK